MNITRFIYDPYCNEMRLDTSGEYVRYADVTLVFQEETKALREELKAALEDKCGECRNWPPDSDCGDCTVPNRIRELEEKAGV